MKNIKAILVLAAIVVGLAATSCQTKHSCPAYGSAKAPAKHRSI
jgi:hypothetical protein